MNPIKQHITDIEAKIAALKQIPPTGQLQIAIGALGTAVEFLNYHVAISAKAPPAPAPAPDKEPAPSKASLN